MQLKKNCITTFENRFAESECGLQTVVLRLGQCGDADNMGLKEMAGEVVNQTFVLSAYICGRLTVRASKPPLL